MPNWCLNTLHINGDSQHINQLPWVDAGLLFEKIIPRPNNLQPVEIESWNRQHWGVKWDSSVELLDRSEDYLKLQFDTPWTTPFNGINAIAKIFPSLSFDLTSSEPGCDWQSSHSWQHGALVHEFHTTYFASEPCTCPKCQAHYFPEIYLDGYITYSECLECGWHY